MTHHELVEKRGSPSGVTWVGYLGGVFLPSFSFILAGAPPVEATPASCAPPRP